MAQDQFWAAQNWVWAASCRRKMSVALGKNTFFKRALAGVRVAHPQMGSKTEPRQLVFCSFTGKHGGARPPPNKQETRKPRTKLPQKSRKTCKNMVFLYTGNCSRRPRMLHRSGKSIHHCVRTVRKPRFSWPEPLIGCWRWGRSSAQIRPASSAAKPPQLFRVSVTFSPRMTATMSRAGCAPPQPPARSSTLRSSTAVRCGPLRHGPAAGRRRRGSGALEGGATTAI